MLSHVFESALFQPVHLFHLANLWMNRQHANTVDNFLESCQIAL